MWAARGGRKGVLAILLEWGCDASAVDNVSIGGYRVWSAHRQPILFVSNTR
jgi:hypothetical protein